MRTIQTTVYKFGELSEQAKEVARTWWREGALDYDWYDCVFGDAKAVGKCMGIDIDKILFSGFNSQGDGACFEGYYSYEKGGLKKVQSHAPTDTELHLIASELQEIQKKYRYKLSASVKQSGRYYHANSTEIGVSYGDDWAPEEAENTIKELLRDFMRWIYKRLENDYEYLMSDESVDESIIINEYEFTENGKIA